MWHMRGFPQFFSYSNKINLFVFQVHAVSVAYGLEYAGAKEDLYNMLIHSGSF